MREPAHPFLTRLAGVDFAPAHGHVSRLGAGVIEATGPVATLGQLCRVSDALAEVVAIDGSGLTLVPMGAMSAVALGSRVELADDIGDASGDAVANRAVDALGIPIDGGGLLRRSAVDTGRLSPAKLDRVQSSQELVTGVRAIDALLPLGVGQRIGLFAASGVGKSTLLDQLARGVRCDRIVICLVGERGREVSSAWAARARYGASRSVTLVAATSDDSPVLRIRAVEQALAIAEHWRDAGEHVLLVIDSITGYAMALREVGLAAGEPAAVRAYTPNVFSALPRVVERCGAVRAGGAISAIMTVLSETDDLDDPIVEVMKSLLDGHIMLSRSLAETGHFPAIDVPRSVSRGGRRLMSSEHAALAQEASAALSIVAENRVMIDSGVYRTGANAQIDRALTLRPALDQFLRQDVGELSSRAQTLAALRTALGSEARRD